ncbi:MAG: ATP-dependent RNA helicase HrpA [Mycobacteriales bacterium]
MTSLAELSDTNAAPVIRYPADLPITQRKDDILAALRDHQVVVVAGETGSGKTTQLPKICLELGRGVGGMIGHTQPRRIAARTVAERIAEELGTELGGAVGYQVRFTDQVGDGTMVKLMTDGILLAEIQRDRMLRRYDTLILDEAHERSLNVDFLIGYLKRLLPRRPDLKLIITSATIDPGRFARHFGDASEVPVIEVSGRTYPVEVRYRPVEDAEDPDQVQAISDAVDELCAEGPGDILVFLSGEREIRDTADALAKRDLPHTEILPLYARLSAAEQHRVFQRHTGRRIVLATNVAETSLTVPGIRYVIDPGTARISRYSHRTKVQRLPIEPISRASANQRKGRCGRLGPGICIRLYSEQDFLARPEFTEPEILRTNLASVILQMTSLKLGEVADFPFLDPPDRRQVKDGLQLLHELGALDATAPANRRRLTPVGRSLAQLPIDPRLARMIVAAGELGCLRELLVIAAALSIQDPRERPADAQQAADEKHARFREPDSDFLAYLGLWRYLQEQQRELSGNQFRRLCRTDFLNYLRVREWQDLHGQLRQAVRGLKLTPNTEPAPPATVHQAILAGLLSHLGLRDAEKNEYQGARNARFAIFPGSTLFKKTPRWVMAAELVETSRLWARVVAKIEPEWAESLASHLVTRSYSEPHWERKRGAVVATEKVTLYGLPIVAGRKVNYGAIDPELSRELFIRHALVEGDWQTHHTFFEANRRLLEEVEDLEHRARRRDILVDDQTLVDFYDQRIPAGIVSGRHFDAWWKKARRTEPDLLTFSRDLLVNQRAAGIDTRDYPDSWSAGLTFPLTYQFEPGADADGVTVHVPLAVLNQVEQDTFDWQVPGLREELVTALIRSLPKALRRHFVPAPDTARAVLDRLEPGHGALLPALERELRRMTGVTIPPGSWQLDRIPDHLRVTFRVEDGRGRPLAEGKDVEALKAQLKDDTRAALAAVAPELERDGLRGWTFGPLPTEVERTVRGNLVKAYPALVPSGAAVAVRLLETPGQQRDAMWRGTRHLLLLNLPSPVKYVLGRLTNRQKLALNHHPYADAAAMFDDCVTAAADALMVAAGGPVWDAEGFARLLAAVRADLNATVLDVVTTVEQVLTTAHEVETRYAEVARGAAAAGLEPSLADIRTQLDGLVYPGFVSATGRRRLADLVRYLRGIDRRLEKLPYDPARDRLWTRQILQVHAAYEDARAELPPSAALDDIRWMIEELRISYFAQTLKTAHPISDKRVYRALDAL